MISQNDWTITTIRSSVNYEQHGIGDTHVDQNIYSSWIEGYAHFLKALVSTSNPSKDLTERSLNVRREFLVDGKRVSRREFIATAVVAKVTENEKLTLLCINRYMRNTVDSTITMLHQTSEPISFHYGHPLGGKYKEADGLPTMMVVQIVTLLIVGWKAMAMMGATVTVMTPCELDVPVPAAVRFFGAP